MIDYAQLMFKLEKLGEAGAVFALALRGQRALTAIPLESFPTGNKVLDGFVCFDDKFFETRNSLLYFAAFQLDYSKLLCNDHQWSAASAICTECVATRRQYLGDAATETLEAVVVLGEILTRQGMLEVSCSLFRDAIDLIDQSASKKRSEVMCGLLTGAAINALARNVAEEAETLLRKVIEFNVLIPKIMISEARALLADALERQTKYSEAVKEYTQSARMVDTYSVPALAVVRYEKALAAAQHTSETAAAFLELGHVYYRRGDYDGAILLIRQALSVHSDDIDTFVLKGWLGIILHQRNNKDEEAVALLRLAFMNSGLEKSWMNQSCHSTGAYSPVDRRSLSKILPQIYAQALVLSPHLLEDEDLMPLVQFSCTADLDFWLLCNEHDLSKFLSPRLCVLYGETSEQVRKWRQWNHVRIISNESDSQSSDIDPLDVDIDPDDSQEQESDSGSSISSMQLSIQSEGWPAEDLKIPIIELIRARQEAYAADSRKSISTEPISESIRISDTDSVSIDRPDDPASSIDLSINSESISLESVSSMHKSDRLVRLELMLGDIIRCCCSSTESIDGRECTIDYLDTSKIRLIDIKDKTVFNFDIHDGDIINDDGVSLDLTGLELIFRHDKLGYARQNGLLPNVWIEIRFNECVGNADTDFVLTGRIVELEEDMISVATEPDGEIIYLDFGYHGIPENLHIVSLVVTDAPNI